jgi:hypothetical protein
MGCGPEFPDFLGDIVVHEPNSDTWGFGKGALSGTVYSAGVFTGRERGKRVGGRRWKAKGQSSNAIKKIQMSNN